jgi:hypothetical protein
MAKHERNDPCHCGSEKKYKKCCLDRDREVERGERPAATIDGSISPTVKDGHIVPRMYQAAWEGEGLQDALDQERHHSRHLLPPRTARRREQ